MYKKIVLKEIVRAIASKPLTASELLIAVRHKRTGVSSFDVQEAAWELMSRDEAELTVDLKLKKVK